MKLTTRKEYEDRNLATRAERMRWWKEARFGMFVHFGLNPGRSKSLAELPRQ